MSISITLILVAIMIGVLLAANLAVSRPALRPLVMVALGIICIAFFVIYGVRPTGQTPLGPLSASALLGARIFCLLFALLALACLYLPFRQVLVGLFPRLRSEPTAAEIAMGLAQDQISDTGLMPVRGFNPESPVHMTALVYCILLVGRTVLEFILAGGLPGLAAEVEAITAGQLLTTMAIFSLFGTVGVGLGIRRGIGAMAKRLGLQVPTPGEMIAGAGMAALGYGLAIGISFLVSLLTAANGSDPNEGQQVSGAISDGINTMLIAFLIGMTAAVGEEIAFRGALQPVFGLFPTSLFFAVVHIQYTLTPASLIILLVGIGLGWLRLRFNTTTAIIAHFLYNFAQIFLLVYLRYLYQVIG